MVQDIIRGEQTFASAAHSVHCSYRVDSVFFLNYVDSTQQSNLAGNHPEEILKDFQEEESGETWVQASRLNSAGPAESYLFWENKLPDQPVTTVYRIYRSETGQLAYRIQDQWDNVKLPDNRFETYYLVERDWIKSRK